MLIEVMPNGSVRMIYSDSMREILDEGQGSIRRASHVEPTIDNKWEADMGPIGGEVLSGFETREEALKAEVEYIEERMFRRGEIGPV